MLAPLFRFRGIVASNDMNCKQRVLCLVALALALACEAETKEDTTAPVPSPTPAEATFVGSQQCAQCHPKEMAAWTDSHHDLAMQEPTSESVLGRFDGAELTLDGERWQFGDHEAAGSKAYRVRVPEVDGEPRVRDIAYVFGVDPLQQYLVRAEGGRLQPLPVAWDSRAESEGGQRWFHLYEGESIRSNDSLHWSGRLQTWNHQCASCHSTNLEKNYDEVTDRYDTRWAEIDVGCEGCHGKASKHVEWAQNGANDATLESGFPSLRGRSASRWSFANGAPIADRTVGPALPNEIDVCAPCHSRRTTLTTHPDPSHAFLDDYLPALLEADLYFDDGQIRDEVYVWGSFVQSRMYAAGVTCSDCHDPHSLEIRDGPDASCGNCHAAEAFATTEHHGHPETSEGASCVACHMPTRTYMGVDARRDHSIRVPRPDLSERIGSPDACTSCHSDRDSRWAASSLATRGALRTAPHPGAAIHAARQGAADAQRELASVVSDTGVSAIMRATAASLLDGSREVAAASATVTALGDSDALVRLGALRALERVEPRGRIALAQPLLHDSVAAVRLEAARILAPAPPENWPPGTRVALAGPLGEYRAGQLANADRFEAQLNLSVLHAQLGETDEAIRRAERALEFEPMAVAARVNLGDLLRATGREAEANAVLRAGVEMTPDSAELHFALGLSLVRQGKSEAALAELVRAAELAPAVLRFAYTYAIALHGLGRSDEAVAALLEATRTSEGASRDASLLFALATIERDRGNRTAAIRWARRLAAANPNDPRPATLLRELGGQPAAN
ncbi:MAG: tetratricopeptide repeat protein [Myxococcota bacterium]|nr:tetratricopeptide repeat protein [Myxococcota bacterium]